MRQIETYGHLLSLVMGRMTQFAPFAFTGDSHITSSSMPGKVISKSYWCPNKKFEMGTNLEGYPKADGMFRLHLTVYLTESAQTRIENKQTASVLGTESTRPYHTGNRALDLALCCRARSEATEHSSYLKCWNQ